MAFLSNTTVFDHLYNGSTQTHADNFQRADENPVSDGGKWTGWTGISTGKLVSHLVEAVGTSTATGGLWTGDGAWPNDQYSEITVQSLSASTGVNVVLPIVRAATGAVTGYRLSVAGPLGTSVTLTMDKYVAGTQTVLVTATPALINSGDVVRLAVIGTTLYAYVNGVLKLSTTDASIASGYPGYNIYTQVNITYAQISAWAGGLAALPISDLDSWSVQNVPVNGAPATSTLVFTHTGASGIAKVQVPNLAVTGLTAYANNAAAVAGGLVAGDLYRTGADPDLVCVVH